MKTSVCQSLFDCIYLSSPFHVVGRPLPGTWEKCFKVKTCFFGKTTFFRQKIYCFSNNLRHLWRNYHIWNMMWFWP